MGFFTKFEGTSYLWGTILVNVICNGASHFYHNTVLNNMQEVLRDFVVDGLNKTHNIEMTKNQLDYVYSICVVSIWSIGAVVGAALAHSIAEQFSRRTCVMIVLNVVSLFSAFLVIIAQYTGIPEFLALGRFSFGLACGFYDVVMGLYITEIAPTSIRGVATSMSMVFGILYGMFISFLGLPNIMGTKDMWAWVITIGTLPSIIPLIVFWKCPLSPKYLYIKLGKKDEAKQVVKKCYGKDADIDAILGHFEEEEKIAGQQVSIAKILSADHLRIPFIVVILTNMSQDTAGIDTVTNFSTATFKSLGVDGYSAKIASIVTQVPNLLGVLVMLALLEKKGRRFLHLGGLSIGLAGVLIIFGSELSKKYWEDDIDTTVGGYFTIIGAALVYFGFGVGPAMIPFFIFGEITPLAARSVVASVAVSLNWSLSVLYDALFIPLGDVMGPWVQLFMAIPTALILLYLWRNMPESRGKTVDEVVKELMKKRKGLAKKPSNFSMDLKKF